MLFRSRDGVLSLPLPSTPSVVPSTHPSRVIPMRSRFPLAGWVGGALCLLAGCTSDWSGHRLDSQSSAASRLPTVAGNRRTAERGKTEQEMTTPRVRTEPSSDKRVVTADVSPGRSTIGSPQRTDRVETTAGLFPSRKGNESRG